MVTRFLTRHIWHDLFEAGISLKAINSIWETLAGIFLLTRLHVWLIHFSRIQVLGDRDDFIFRFLSNQIHHLDIVSVRTFVGIYLLFHGLLNAFLAYNLFKNRLWAYPVMVGFSALFLLYQVYRLVHTPSALLLAVTIFDSAFIGLTLHEYEYQKKKRSSEPSSQEGH